MPHRFAQLSDRLVTQNGVFLMGLAAVAALSVGQEVAPPPRPIESSEEKAARRELGGAGALHHGQAVADERPGDDEQHREAAGRTVPEDALDRDLGQEQAGAKSLADDQAVLAHDDRGRRMVGAFYGNVE